MIFISFAAEAKLRQTYLLTRLDPTCIRCQRSDHKVSNRKPLSEMPDSGFWPCDVIALTALLLRLTIPREPRGCNFRVRWGWWTYLGCNEQCPACLVELQLIGCSSLRRWFHLTDRLSELPPRRRRELGGIDCRPASRRLFERFCDPLPGNGSTSRPAYLPG